MWQININCVNMPFCPLVLSSYIKLRSWHLTELSPFLWILVVQHLAARIGSHLGHNNNPVSKELNIWYTELISDDHKHWKFPTLLSLSSCFFYIVLSWPSLFYQYKQNIFTISCVCRQKGQVICPPIRSTCLSLKKDKSPCLSFKLFVLQKGQVICPPIRSTCLSFKKGKSFVLH